VTARRAAWLGAAWLGAAATWSVLMLRYLPPLFRDEAGARAPAEVP
jgi:hypothetical protein